MNATITPLLPRTDDLVSERAGLRRMQISPTRWRITQLAGAVVGYVETRMHEGAPDPAEYRAMKMRPDRRGFLEVGVFESFESAFDGLRWL